MEKVKEWREGVVPKLTQKKIAARLHIHEMTYSRYERMVLPIPVPLAWKIIRMSGNRLALLDFYPAPKAGR